MRLRLISLMMLVIAFGVVEVVACVQCTPSGNLWVCVSSPQGGLSCATSTNQQQCVLNGVCRPPGEDEGGPGGIEGPGRQACTVKRIGKVTVSQDVLDAVSAQSKLFGDALALSSKSGSLGAEETKVFTLLRKVVVEISVEVLFENKHPSAIRLTRSDNLESLTLSIAQELDLSVIDENRWKVTNWNIN